MMIMLYFFFFFNDTATTEIYTLSLHDALPISRRRGRPARGRCHLRGAGERDARRPGGRRRPDRAGRDRHAVPGPDHGLQDRKSTRLNSSHANISYAVFCLKKKKKTT